ncbi:MAG: hypothetical protein ACREB3_13405, partial [Burkholderiales bacterium]
RVESAHAAAGESIHEHTIHLRSQRGAYSSLVSQLAQLQTGLAGPQVGPLLVEQMGYERVIHDLETSIAQAETNISQSAEARESWSVIIHAAHRIRSAVSIGEDEFPLAPASIKAYHADRRRVEAEALRQAEEERQAAALIETTARRAEEARIRIVREAAVEAMDLDGLLDVAGAAPAVREAFARRLFSNTAHHSLQTRCGVDMRDDPGRVRAWQLLDARAAEILANEQGGRLAAPYAGR